MAVAEDPPLPVFERELIRSLRDGIHKQNGLLTDLRDVLRDLRDELAYAREQRTKANAS